MSLANIISSGDSAINEEHYHFVSRQDHPEVTEFSRVYAQRVARALPEHDMYDGGNED